MIKERRKHPRLRIPLEAEYLVAGREEWREGTIWTLGAGGAALLCEERLDKGTRLDGLHFLIEAEGDLPETRIEVGAEVVGIDRKSDFGRPSNFMLALRFIDLGESEFELLRQFVFRRLTSSSPGDERPAAGEKGRPPIEIRFKLFDEFVEEVSESLSPSGMFIRAHRPLPPGSKFVFQFQLGDDFSLFQGTAEVVWTRRRSEDPERPPGMGVRFLKLDLTSQKMVRRLVGQRSGTAAAEDDAADGEADPPVAGSRAPAPSAEAAAAPAVAAEPPPNPVTVAGHDAPEEAADGTAREAELALRHSHLEERLGELAAARDEARQMAARLEAEVEELRRENRSLEASRDEAEVARGRAQAEMKELLGELEALRPDDEAQEELRLAGEEMESRRREWAELEAALRADLQRRDGAEVDFRQRLEQAAEVEERLRRQLEESDEGALGMRQELERLRETEAEQGQRLEQAATVEAQLRERLETAGDTVAELRKSAELSADVEAELRERLELAEASGAELVRMTERAESAEDGLARLERESDEARQERDAAEAELRSELGEQDAVAVALRRQVEERDALESELRAQLEERGAVEAELRQQLSEARDTQEELERRLARHAEVESELRDQARQLRMSRDDSQERLERSRHQLDRMRAAAEEMKSRFNGDLSAARALETDLASRLAEVAEVGTSLERQVEGLTAARASLAERLARITGAWSSLEDGLAEVQAEAGEQDAALPEPSDGASVEPDPPAMSASLESDPLVEPDLAPEDLPDEELVAAAESDPEPARLETPAADPVAATATHTVPVELPDPEPQTVEVIAEPVESAPPVPARSSRLADAARRAVARLGLGRKPAPESAPDEEPESAPRPSPEAEVEAVAAGAGDAGEVEIEETIKAWAAAWSEQRVDDYLSFYSPEFETARAEGGGETNGAAHAWLPPLAGMELTLGPISRTKLAPGRVAVRFEQSVETDSYTRRTGRTLEMVREADAWKIAAESFQEL